ncbi:hypothetical protein [uncultured Spongiibacter sp.]|uniref:hypothetical protein n=1 Tax=uncultured Spongiibacter sp. TaxID=870896 RepID=UPI0025835746|nr:hypothetical protein [uncultured Spongiibacter sp.]
MAGQGSQDDPREPTSSLAAPAIDPEFATALDELVVDGIRTNTELHRDLVRDNAFAKGGVSIHYLEKKLKI